MKKIKEILKSEKKKHKEKVTYLAERAKNDKKLIAELFELLKIGTDVERGTVVEVMKFISKDKPDMMSQYIDILIEYVNYKTPRIK